jgi:hypothetical protein
MAGKGKDYTWTPGDQLPGDEILTDEELAEDAAFVARVGKIDPADTEEDDELDSLIDLDDEAEVLATVAGGARGKGRGAA